MNFKKEREALILKFVEDNRGTSEYNVYTKLKIATKDTIIGDIDDLVEDKKLFRKVITRQNYKIHKLYVNLKNEVYSMNQQLIKVESVIKNLPIIETKIRRRPGTVYVPDKEFTLWWLQLLLIGVNKIYHFKDEDKDVFNKKIMRLMLQVTEKQMEERRLDSKAVLDQIEDLGVGLSIPASIKD